MTLKILIALMMSAFREAQADESVMISLLFLIHQSAWKGLFCEVGLLLYGILGSWMAEMCGPSCFFDVLKARNGFFLDEPAQLRFREAFRFHAPVFFSEGDHPVCEVLEVHPKVGAPVLFAGSLHSGLAKLPVAHKPKAEHLLHQPLVY